MKNETFTPERIKAEADAFFEWDGEDRSLVTTTSCLLFAQHIAGLIQDRAAQPAPVVPEGYVLVPVEPTEAMRAAYEMSAIAPMGPISIYGYRAMLAAAPAQGQQLVSREWMARAVEAERGHVIGAGVAARDPEPAQGQQVAIIDQFAAENPEEWAQAVAHTEALDSMYGARAALVKLGDEARALEHLDAAIHAMENPPCDTELCALKTQQVGQEPTVKDCLTVQPVAYAVFAENGNIRIWCADPIQAETLRQQYGAELRPLYTVPQPAPAQDVAGLVEALIEAADALDRAEFFEQAEKARAAANGGGIA